MKPSRFSFYILVIALVLFLFPPVLATVHYDPANNFIFTFPAYGTAMRFASAETFTSVSRIGNFWYFDGLEFSIQNANLTVDSLWASNIFQGHVSGSDGQLAIVSIYASAYSLPTSVLSSSATVVQVADSVAFLASATSCWFYDSASGRTYMKILVSGYTSFSADYNVAAPRHGGSSGGPSSSQTIQVSDCTVNVVSGGRATALINVSWNFVGTVSLSAVTFQGESADWLRVPALPLTLGTGNGLSVPVVVPDGVQDGSYVVQVGSQWSFQGGMQSVVSRVTVRVGAVGASGFDWGLFGPVAGWFSEGYALLLVNFWLVLMSTMLMVMLVVVAVVARRRR